jgi:8-oxo-dGTP pyrophosphatase MutT (NUDIX family)
MARARTETAKGKARPVARPRDAASLILLREGERGLEVLIGRRGKGARFMPGRYVFPGGRTAPGDARPWQGEASAPEAAAERALLALKRAALRETFEETGLVIGRPVPAGARSDGALSAIEQAYRAAGAAPAPELLRLIGRAITPTNSPIRFHARFFIADGAHALGRLVPCEELDDLHWHPVAEEPPGAMQNVTRFMLTCALDAWRGAATAEPPLYWHRGKHTLVRRGQKPR